MEPINTIRKTLMVSILQTPIPEIEAHTTTMDERFQMGLPIWTWTALWKTKCILKTQKITKSMPFKKLEIATFP